MAGALGLKEEIATPGAAGPVETGRAGVDGERGERPARLRCERWPPFMSLVNERTGELVRGRCGATNLCEYCARRAAIENAELLALDGLNGTAPAYWMVLGTRGVDPRPAAYRVGRQEAVRAARRVVPGLEWAQIVEFTTGDGARSSGVRRPHWNLLVKGIGDDAQAERVAAAVIARWCELVDAEPHAQFFGKVSEVGGLMRYLALHFHKESQRPPPGWKGHRLLKSRHYLWTATATARTAAQRSIRSRQLLYLARRRGLDATAADAEVSAQLEQLDSWRLRFHSDPIWWDDDLDGRAARQRRVLALSADAISEAPKGAEPALAA